MSGDYLFNDQPHLTSADIARNCVALVNARAAQTARRCEAAAWLAAGALGMLGALAVYLFMQPCSALSLCMGVAGLPGRWGASRASERAWADGATPEKVEPAEPLSPASAALENSMRALQRHAFDEGERAGYVAGARAGRVAWLCMGLLAGACITAALIRWGGLAP